MKEALRGPVVELVRLGRIQQRRPCSLVGGSGRADASHTYPGTCRQQQTVAAPREDRAADILTPGHQIEIDHRPPAPPDDAIERLLGLLRRAGAYPAEP